MFYCAIRASFNVVCALNRPQKTGWTLLVCKCNFFALHMKCLCVHSFSECGCRSVRILKLKCSILRQTRSVAWSISFYDDVDVRQMLLFSVTIRSESWEFFIFFANTGWLSSQSYSGYFSRETESISRLRFSLRWNIIFRVFPGEINVRKFDW